jgi:benzylsuccinate CoA-transferase BbsF subunit
MTAVDQTRVMSFTIGKAFEGVESSYVFNAINLNKLSVKLNLKKPQAIDLAKRIVQVSDIVAENMRPGTMERLGLGYNVLRAVKPDIIMLSSSAFGGKGPQRAYGGYAPSFACASGLANLTGYRDRTPNPMTGSTDLMAAISGAFSLIMALNYKQKTGLGQYIDLSSVESQAILAGDAVMDYFMNGRVQYRNGNRDRIMAPHNCYRCRGDDKWVSIAISAPEEWDSFCEILGNPQWTRDERFADAYERWKHQEELDKLVTAWTINYTHYEVTDMLQKVGVAAMPSLSNEEIVNDPHFKHRGITTTVEHPVMGEVVVFGVPWQFSKTPAKITKAAPVMGESNDYVFRELLGLPSDEISRLVDEGVIQ